MSAGRTGSSPVGRTNEKTGMSLISFQFLCAMNGHKGLGPGRAQPVRQHGVLSNRLRAKATVRGAEGGRRCMQRGSSPVGRVPLPHPFTFVSSPPASYSSPDFCHLTPFRSKPPDFFCCIWLYMKKAGANPLRSFRFLVLHSHRLHPIRHQPGGQVSFLFPSMWKCRCFTVWKASSPLLLTTR